MYKNYIPTNKTLCIIIILHYINCCLLSLELSQIVPQTLILIIILVIGVYLLRPYIDKHTSITILQ